MLAALESTQAVEGYRIARGVILADVDTVLTTALVFHTLAKNSVQSLFACTGFIRRGAVLEKKMGLGLLYLLWGSSSDILLLF